MLRMILDFVQRAKGEHCVQLDHVHAIQKTHPTLADGVTVTGGTASWERGSFVEVVPANAITSPFDIH